jgi:hypothetical protein
MFLRPVAPCLLLLTALATAAPSAVAAPPPAKAGFAIQEKPDRLIITDGGKPVAEYVFNDPAIKRPYFANVRTPSGIQVTRNNPPIEGQDLVDHPTFHPGIWWGFGDLNGEDYWRNKGTIRHDRFNNRILPDGSAIINDFCSLVDSSDTKIGAAYFSTQWSRKALSLSKVPSYHLSCAAVIKSDQAELALGDQEEMGLGVRLASPLAEKNGGIVTGEGGKQGAAAIWGTRSRWCDYSGQIKGRPLGVTALVRHLPSNPTWWHVRDYGLLVANGFGKRSRPDQPEPTIRRGRGLPFLIGYELIIHDAPDYDAAQAVDRLTEND